MNQINYLTDTALLPRAIRDFAGSLQEDILTCNDPERLQAYIDAALDVECLGILAEISEVAPLNEVAYKVFVSLVCSVYREAGHRVPTRAREEFVPLNESETAWLEDLKRQLRSAQRKAKFPVKALRQKN